jgi:hypothetical protein
MIFSLLLQHHISKLSGISDLLREIISVSFEKNVKDMNALCGQKIGVLSSDQ